MLRADYSTATTPVGVLKMNQRAFASALALAVACTATAVFSQTTPPVQPPKLRAGEDCNLSHFCGVPYEYMPPSASQTSPDSSAKFVNGKALQMGGHIGTGSCFGSPICPWGLGKETVNHVEYKPDMGYTYAYPLKFPE